MKKIYLTESELRGVINNTISEAFFTGGTNPLSRVGNMLGGLKGVYRGDGYEYGKSLTSLGRFLRKLKKLDKPNTEIIGYLDILSQKIDKSKMSQDKKTALKDLIDSVKKEFTEYQTKLDDVINKISSNNITQPTNSSQSNRYTNTNDDKTWFVSRDSEDFKWYYLDNDGNTKGAYAIHQIEMLINMGDINRTTPVWKSGMPGWANAFT
ncbi:MAG: DUF4339 domain-containing protein, partial [Minisyncoccia bacterium]